MRLTIGLWAFCFLLSSMLLGIFICHAEECVNKDNKTMDEWNEEIGFGLYNPKTPMTHFQIADMPDIHAADAARTIFPVTGQELVAYHNALLEFNKVINAHSTSGKNLQNFINESARAFLEQYKPTPDCVVLYNALDNLASHKDGAKEGWPIPGQWWLEDIPWCHAFQDEAKEVYALQETQKRSLREPGPAVIRTVLDGNLPLLSSYVQGAFSPEIIYQIKRRVTLAFMSYDPKGIDHKKITPNRQPQHSDEYANYIGANWINNLQYAAKATGEAAIKDFYQIVYNWTYGPEGHGPNPSPQITSILYLK